MFNQTIKNKLALLPVLPGCYLMKDRDGIIIYVGKAKILKNRVKSYFTGSHNEKTQHLVNEIEDLEYIVTRSNIEALLLELNLIKKYHPKYNIMLKDDKTYPYLKLTNERHPRLVITRNIMDDQAKYFGPYPNVTAAMNTKKLLEKLFPLRRCPLNNGRPCLYYQLGLCIGPCAKEISVEEYNERIEKIVHFLKGGHSKVKRELEIQMNEAAEKLDFKKAAELRDQIQSIEITIERQTMMNADHKDRDIFGFASNEGWMCVQVFFVRNGKLIERKVSVFPSYDDPNEEFLTFIVQFYKGLNQIVPSEILLPEGVDREALQGLLDIRAIIPKRGDKRKLVQLAQKNAMLALKEKLTFLNINSK